MILSEQKDLLSKTKNLPRRGMIDMFSHSSFSFQMFCIILLLRFHKIIRSIIIIIEKFIFQLPILEIQNSHIFKSPQSHQKYHQNHWNLWKLYFPTSIFEIQSSQIFPKLIRSNIRIIEILESFFPTSYSWVSKKSPEVSSESLKSLKAIFSNFWFLRFRAVISFLKSLPILQSLPILSSTIF